MGSGSRILHVGCGYQRLPVWFKDFEEVRLDIDPACKPDIVASLTDLGDIGTYRMVYSEHCLEHLYPYQVPRALAEFYRVLEPTGIAIIYVPDLEDVKATLEVLMETPAGPVCGLDLIYGHGPQLEARPYMAHHCGFVAETLAAAMARAGFEKVTAKRLLDFNLIGTGVRP
jgi:SAM-dependent methyltransferase